MAGSSGFFARRRIVKAARDRALVLLQQRNRALLPPEPKRHVHSCVGQPYNDLPSRADSCCKCLFLRWLIRSARFLLRSTAVLLPADCGQVPCSAGKVEVCHECKQRREASAQARTPVRFLSRSVFNAGHDCCRHGDFRTAGPAGGPHVPEGLVHPGKQRGAALPRTFSALHAMHAESAPARAHPSRQARRPDCAA